MTLRKETKLKKHQVQGVNFMLAHNYVLNSDMQGLGKSLQSIAVQQANDLDCIIICPYTLRYNWLEEYKKFTDEKRVTVGLKKNKINIVNYEQIYKCTELFIKADLVVIDECFDGSTEILTEKGFQRFDQLDKNLEVAQSDLEGNITFVYPEKFIEKDYYGSMVKFESDNKIDVFCTEGHEFLTTDMKGNWIKKPALSVRTDYNHKIRLAGKAKDRKDNITPLERLLIAFQADGSIHNKGRSLNTQMLFSFSKERKIKRFLNLMESGEFNFSEVKGQRGKRRFIVRIDKKYDKDISKYFTIPNLSLTQCRQILEEASNWDGYSQGKTGFGYSNTCEKTVDFYQALAVLAGYKAKKTRIVDNREERYKDCFKLSITNNEISSLIGAKKSIDTFEGKVYCVRVPEGNIVIRRGGKPCIIGNCHYLINPEAQRTEYAHRMIKKYKPERLILLTGTPVKERVSDFYSLIKLLSYTPIRNNGRLITDKYDTHTKFNNRFSNRVSFNVRVKGKRGGEFTKKIVKYTGVKNERELIAYMKFKYIRRTAKKVLDLPPLIFKDIPINYKNNEALQTEFDKFLKGEEYDVKTKTKAACVTAPFTSDYVVDLMRSGEKPIIIFSEHIEPLKIISEKLKKKKFSCAFIIGEVGDEQRQSNIQNFQRGEIDVLLCSYGAASTGITLTRSRNMVLNDESWEASTMSQALKRFHRIGQNRTCIVHRIIGTGTNKKINQTLKEKQQDISKIIRD
jgi:SNF2 family DNA or RNA helicase